MDYLGVLQRLHKLLRPDAYLEIGVAQGMSLGLSRSKSIGVDPALVVTGAAVTGKPWVKLYQTTSDDFFERYDPASVLEESHLGLAFIDGLHHFEQVLRDFINVERWSAPGSVVAIHDVIPPDVPSTSRTPCPGHWVGDVWKLVPCLAEHRPDLVMDIVTASPSGLLVVRRLDAASTVLGERYDEIAGRSLDHGDEAAAVTEYLAGLKSTSPSEFLGSLNEACRRAVMLL